MSWRTYLMNIIECFKSLPGSLLEDTCHELNAGLLGGLVAGSVVLGISAVGWILFQFFMWACRKWRVHHSYTIWFREGNHGLTPMNEFKTVSIGTHYLDVMIRAERKVSIEHADIRFAIDTKHRQQPRSDANTDDIEITGAEDLDLPTTRFWWRIGLDQAGGVDMGYSPAYNRTKGDFVRIRIKVEARREWQGYLSFRESRTYASTPFRVIK